MNGFLLVALGGALGASCRYGAGLAASRFTQAPGLYATLFVNVLGSALIGALMAWLTLREQNALTNALFLFCGVGLLGGFTTFSAFSLEVVHAINEGRYVQSGTYILASLIGGICALMLSFALMKRILA
ncbi:MAG: CrcB family protein [Pseudomonadota bacterium]